MAHWKHLKKQADDLVETDPARACELYTQALSEAPAKDHRQLLECRADAFDRQNMSEAARADRGQIIALLDAELAEHAKTSQAPKVPTGLFEDMSFDDQRCRWEQRAEANRKLGLEVEARADLTAAVAHIDYQLQHCKRPRRVHTLFREKASILDLLGDLVDADRCRLLAADVLAAGSGDNSAGAAIATAPVYVAMHGVMGFEYADAFRAGWNSSQMAQVEAERASLLDKNRAYGLGLCRKCKDIVRVSADHKDLRRHKTDAVRYFVEADAERAWGELLTAMPAKWHRTPTPLAATLPELADVEASPAAASAPPRTPTAPPTAPSNMRAGWYPDPAGRHQYRYWDGERWSDDVADNGITARDPQQLPDQQRTHDAAV